MKRPSGSIPVEEDLIHLAGLAVVHPLVRNPYFSPRRSAVLVTAEIQIYAERGIFADEYVIEVPAESFLLLPAVFPVLGSGKSQNRQGSVPYVLVGNAVNGHLTADEKNGDALWVRPAHNGNGRGGISARGIRRSADCCRLFLISLFCSAPKERTRTAVSPAARRNGRITGSSKHDSAVSGPVAVTARRTGRFSTDLN